MSFFIRSAPAPPLLLLVVLVSLGLTRAGSAQEYRISAEGFADRDNYFGSQVAIEGDVALVGSDNDDVTAADDEVGAAYVYARDVCGVNQWCRVKRLLPPDTSEDDGFGARVALRGTLAAVSATYADVNCPAGNPSCNRGAVYLYERFLGTGWELYHTLSIPQPVASLGFGIEVAIVDDVAAVTYRRASNSYWIAIFERNSPSAGAWGKTMDIDGGYSNKKLALSEDGQFLAVGSTQDNTWDGAVYLYERDHPAEGAWGLRKSWAGPAGKRFGMGQSIDIDGTTLIVGMPDYTPDGLTCVGNYETEYGCEMGMVQLFEKDEGGTDNWGKVAEFTGDDDSRHERMGSTVAMDGNVAISGSGMHSGPCTVADTYCFGRGAGYVLRKDASLGWQVATVLHASDRRQWDSMGNASDVSGNWAIFGATGSDLGCGEQCDYGAAYLFGPLSTAGSIEASASNIVAADGVVVFNSSPTAVSATFEGVTGASRLTVERLGTPPLDTSSIPDSPIHDQHFLIREELITPPTASAYLVTWFSSAALRVDLDALPDHQITDPAGVVAYLRAEYGAGSFSPLSTRWDEAENELVLEGLTAFGEIVLAGGGSLPVEIDVFVARVEGRDVLLAWETASESRNAGFAIERLLRRGSGETGVWVEVGFVKGAGSSIDRNAYAHRVSGLSPGGHSFRLRQLDLDGASRFSGVLEVAIELPEGYQVEGPYPNPFNGRSRMTIWTAADQHLEVHLYDALGRRVRTLFTGAASANRPIPVFVDGDGLTGGLYAIRVEGQTGRFGRTLVLSK